ncbi:P-loop containing nucleoside triphosphate hydrolase protein [Mrakia frigida]|uniref:gluconokinase n=1 Tax=Mrakia frigida TaxID=29902 RepID=UPI003FCC1EFF
MSSSSSISSPLSLSLFLLSSALYFAAASSNAPGSTQGGGSAALEKEARKEDKEDGSSREAHSQIGGHDGPKLGKKPVVIYVMGVCGCGKSTTGLRLSELLKIPYFDGDSLHTPENVAKMHANNPLNDSDRIPWLKKIQQHGIDELANNPGGCIIAASSLKFAYREIQRGNELPPNALDVLPNGLPASPSRSQVQTLFVYLKGTPEVLAERMAGRKGHYMGSAMLTSQLATMEDPPKNGEQGIIVVDIDQAEEGVTQEAYRGVLAAIENQ